MTTVEQALRTLTAKLAMARLMTDLMAQHPDYCEARSLSGLADVCEEMVQLAIAVRAALPVDALDLTVRRSRPA
jgi:hypothetical protein